MTFLKYATPRLISSLVRSQLSQRLAEQRPIIFPLLGERVRVRARRKVVRGALAACLIFGAFEAQAAHRIKVEAGDYDRIDAVVSFKLAPGRLKIEDLKIEDLKIEDLKIEDLKIEDLKIEEGRIIRGEAILKDERGKLLPVQIDGAGEAVFIEPRLKKGESKVYTLESASSDKSPPPILATNQSGRLKISLNLKPVLEYQAHAGELPRPEIKAEYKRGGYIHPVHTPSGRIITDHYARNHLHQHGLWFAWTKTEFEGRSPDFWNMGQGKGKVEFVALDSAWSGAVHAGFQARHRYVDLTASEPKTVLHETWRLNVYALPEAGYFLYDLVSTQSCATDKPLQLPKYHYGGMGFRGNWDWNRPANTFFLTSEGETDRIKANETHARWCHISGMVDGLRAGLAILGHPANFRAPQPMRVHPTEPFFCFAPAQDGDWQIEPGRPYVSAYRFVVKDGAPEKALIDRLWNDYAHPPKVIVQWD